MVHLRLLGNENIDNFDINLKYFPLISYENLMNNESDKYFFILFFPIPVKAQRFNYKFTFKAIIFQFYNIKIIYRWSKDVFKTELKYADLFLFFN